MAGIGFELKKLFKQKGVLALLRAYGYTGMITAGPMLLGVIFLLGIGWIGQAYGMPRHAQDLLNSMITYDLLLSLLLTSTVSLVMCRFIADAIFDGSEQKVMPSLKAVLLLLLLPGDLFYSIFLLHAGITWQEALWELLLFNELVTVFLEMNYLTAIKDYKGILYSYGITILASFVFAIVLSSSFGVSVSILLCSVTIGYGIMAVMNYLSLNAYFPRGSSDCFLFLQWFDEYRELLWIGFLTNIGLFAPIVLAWFGPIGICIQGWFYAAPQHDVPALYAFLTILITCIDFVSSVEVHFYPHYRKYYDLFNGKGSITEIEAAEEELLTVLGQELRYTAKRQLFMTTFMISIGVLLLEILPLGFDSLMDRFFRILSVGYGIYAVGNVFVMMLLYFTAYREAFWSSFVFALSSTAFSILTLLYADRFYGFGFAVASMLYFLISLAGLIHFTKDLPYHILSTQPIIQKKRSGCFSRLHHWIRRIPVFSMLCLFLFTACARWPHFDSSETIILPARSENDTVLTNPYQGLAMDGRRNPGDLSTDLIYVETTLKEINPAPGIYDFSSFEDRYQLKLWYRLGKHLVFRLILDRPEEQPHRDIPDWLYEETKDGQDYQNAYGAGYAPDYTNPRIIKANEDAIRSLGDYFAGYDDPSHRNPDFLSYVELGSLGHWGEWHSKTEDGLPPIPEEKIRTQYIAPYLDAFPKARLLFRRPFHERPEGSGLFNDMTGDPEATASWLHWIREGGIYDEPHTPEALKAAPSIWNTAPIGGEFTSSLPMTDLMIRDFSKTRNQILDSHMTFLGPKIPLPLDILSEEEELSLSENDRKTYTKHYIELLNSFGYRYSVNRLSYRKKGRTLTLTLKNSGSAPLYFTYVPCIYIGNQRFPLDADLSKLTADKTIDLSIVLPERYVNADVLSLDMDTTGTSGKPSSDAVTSSGNTSVTVTSEDKTSEETIFFSIENVDAVHDKTKRLALAMDPESKTNEQDRRYPIATLQYEMIPQDR